MDNITNVYKLPCVVAINRFPHDTDAELELVERKCRELGVDASRIYIRYGWTPSFGWNGANF